MKARIRDIFGEYHSTTVEALDTPQTWAVTVSGLGHLVVFLPADVADGPPQAILTQGPGREQRRHVKTLGTIDGRRWHEVELLPNSSGEDRIVVVIEP